MDGWVDGWMDGRSVVGGLAGCSVVGLEDEKSGRSSRRKKKTCPTQLGNNSNNHKFCYKQNDGMNSSWERWEEGATNSDSASATVPNPCFPLPH